MRNMVDMVVRGGGFLLTEVTPEQVFVPEELSDEHKQIRRTTRSFAEKEVAPFIEDLEQHKDGLMRKLIQQAGELGLLGLEVPEEFGGMGMDKYSAVVVGEEVPRGGSFAVSFAAHTGIGTLPIVYFGTPEQKEKYLPGLANGEKIAAYCLTEPGSGSDALGAKTTAVLSEDGRYYLLNGTKQFITNAGFADIFLVYAKVDGKLTNFIVERDMQGLSLGPEEQKMGIKGSSTRQVILDDVKVPVENVVGEVGRGHVVAFNILNVGRFKLAASATGSSRIILNVAAKYAAERKQFSMPINSFGAVQNKLAAMAARIYTAESVVYRTSGLMEQGFQGLNLTGDCRQAAGKALEEYAIECSLNKILASEVLDMVVDEGVQIHGGYGFIKEYPIERMYRDARINRLFEGTNEINRLLVSGTLLKRGQSGDLPLFAAAKAISKELLAAALAPAAGLKGLLQLAAQAKKIWLMTAGLAAQSFGNALKDDQFVLMALAEMVLQIYALESAVLRAVKLESLLVSKANRDFAAKSATLAVYEGFNILQEQAAEVLNATVQGDAMQTALAGLRKLARRPNWNVIDIRRQIARMVMGQEGYPLT